MEASKRGSFFTGDSTGMSSFAFTILLSRRTGKHRREYSSPARELQFLAAETVRAGDRVLMNPAIVKERRRVCVGGGGGGNDRIRTGRISRGDPNFTSVNNIAIRKAAERAAAVELALTFPATPVSLAVRGVMNDRSEGSLKRGQTRVIVTLTAA